MRLPKLETIEKMTQSKFDQLIRKASFELENNDQPKNKDELELLTLLGSMGSAIYITCRKQGISKYSEYREVAKEGFNEYIVNQAFRMAYPNYIEFYMNGMKKD